MTEKKKRERQILSVLQSLSRHALGFAPHADERICLLHEGVPLLTLPEHLLVSLRKKNYVCERGQELHITPAGRTYLARILPSRLKISAQGQVTENRKLKGRNGTTEAVSVHINESPLAWLRLRKGKGGASLLNETQFSAGEKLRADFTRAQLTPRITSRWDESYVRQSGQPAPHDFTDNTLAARACVEAALKAVGSDLSGILLDVCCFLKGLKIVETERKWPQRTAKVVLKLALDRLARHYGLTQEAVGKGRSKIRHWGAEGYRPEILY